VEFGVEFTRSGYLVAKYDIPLKVAPPLFKDKDVTIFDALETRVAALYKLRIILMQRVFQSGKSGW